MKFGKALNDPMTQTAPVWESLHWKSSKVQMTRPARRTQEDRMLGCCWPSWGSRWRTSPPCRTFRGARAHIHALDVQTSRTSQPGDASQDATEHKSRGQSVLAAVRGGADNFTLFTEMIAAEKKAGDRCDGKGKDQGVRWPCCRTSSTSRSHIC